MSKQGPILRSWMGTNGGGHHSTQYWDEDVTGHEGVAWRSPSKGGGRLGGGWSLWVEGRGRMRKGTKQEGQDVLGAEQWGGGGSRCCEDCPQMSSSHRPCEGEAVSFSGLVFHPRHPDAASGALPGVPGRHISASSCWHCTGLPRPGHQPPGPPGDTCTDLTSRTQPGITPSCLQTASTSMISSRREGGAGPAQRCCRRHIPQTPRRYVHPGPLTSAASRL